MTVDDKLIDLVASLERHPTLRYAERPGSAITHIILHHAAAETGPQDWARYHVEHHGWPGIAYHAVVMRDGRAFKTNLDKTIAYHAGAQYNLLAVGICLQGDLTQAPPTGAQLAKLALVVRRYMRAYKIPPQHILGHGQVMQTTCPGAMWVVDWLRVLIG